VARGGTFIGEVHCKQTVMLRAEEASELIFGIGYNNNGVPGSIAGVPGVNILRIF